MAIDPQVMMDRVAAQRHEIDVDIGRRDVLRSETRTEEQHLTEERGQQALYDQTRTFLRSVLESTQSVIEDTFTGLTTAGVAGIFGDDKALRFQFVPTAQGVAVKIRVLKPSPYNENEVFEINPQIAEGGGMLDIISLGLRLGLMELYTPRQDGPMMLDEICKYLADDDTLQAAGDFMQQVSHDSGRQMILITHKGGLSAYADRLFEFKPGPNLTVRVEMED